MRKSGPFRSIRLCAYTTVGADSGVAGVVIAGRGVPREVVDATGLPAGVDDLRCQNSNTNKKAGTAMRIAVRVRIQNHSIEMVFSPSMARRPPGNEPCSSQPVQPTSADSRRSLASFALGIRSPEVVVGRGMKGNRNRAELTPPGIVQACVDQVKVIAVSTQYFATAFHAATGTDRGFTIRAFGYCGPAATRPFSFTSRPVF